MEDQLMKIIYPSPRLPGLITNLSKLEILFISYIVLIGLEIVTVSVLNKGLI